MTDTDSPRHDTKDNALAIDFPVPPAPLRSPRKVQLVTWAQYMDEIEWHLERHLRLHDNPEERLSRKLRDRFVM